MRTFTDPRPSTQPGPAWLVELLEVMELRRRTLLLAIGGVAAVGLLVALVLPDYLPPRPAVGAAVGFAAVLLGVAITFGLDSLDLKVRGPRHVRSSGGLLAQQLAGAPSPAALSSLVADLRERAADQGRVLVGVSPIDAELDAEGWQDALCSALADGGLRVLTVDLQRPAEAHPGVVEVAEGRTTLADAVTFDGERMVARLGPGRDPVAAVGGLRAVVGRLPSDIDVLVVLLPPPSGGGVLGAASALDHVYLLAEVDRTARVDLIAALDAFDAAQASSQVLLVSAAGPAAAVPAVAVEDRAEDVAAEPADEPADEPELESAEEPAVEATEEPALESADEPAVEAAEEPALEAAEEPALEAPEQPAGEPPLEHADEPALEAPDEPVLGPADEPSLDEADEEQPETAAVEPVADVRPYELDPADDPVVASPDRQDPQLRLTLAEAAVELAALADLDQPIPDTEVGLEGADAAPTAEEPAPSEPEPVTIDEGDPTVETPPVVIDLGSEPEDEPTIEPAAESTPAPAVDAPFADQPDLPEDPERIAAAMQGIGYGLWAPSTRVPSAPRG